MNTAAYLHAPTATFPQSFTRTRKQTNPHETKRMSLLPGTPPVQSGQKPQNLAPCVQARLSTHSLLLLHAQTTNALAISPRHTPTNKRPHQRLLTNLPQFFGPLNLHKRHSADPTKEQTLYLHTTRTQHPDLSTPCVLNKQCRTYAAPLPKPSRTYTQNITAYMHATAGSASFPTMLRSLDMPSHAVNMPATCLQARSCTHSLLRLKA